MKQNSQDNNDTEIYTQAWKTQLGIRAPAPAATFARKRNSRAPAERLALCVVFAAAIAIIALAWEEMVAGEQVTVPPSAVKFKSDNTLTKDWFYERIGLDASTRVSVASIRANLDGIAQIKRILKVEPHTFSGDGIDVEIEERKPVLRLAYPPHGNYPNGETLMVADDGTVFRGINLSNAVQTNRLPLLVDAKLAPASNFDDTLRQPSTNKAHWRVIGTVPGMEQVSKLLRLITTLNPDIPREWKNVSVRQFTGGNPKTPGATIRVKINPKIQPATSARLNEIIFSADPVFFENEVRLYSNQEFRNQFARKLAIAEKNHTPEYDLHMYFRAQPENPNSNCLPRLIPPSEFLPPPQTHNFDPQ